MATNLYEALGISSNDATPEQIRKAYRKKALQTHPDRLRPDASAEEKAAAEEQFRQVNNAYEVLSNEEKRELYDRHGVWPPPQVYEDDRHHRYEPHERQNSFGRDRDPFAQFFDDGPFGSSFPFRTGPGASFPLGGGMGASFPFGSRARSPFFDLTNPFELFQHVFRNDPFFSDALREDPFFASARSPFGASSPFGGPRSPFGSSSPFGAMSMFPEMQMLTGPGGFGMGSGSGSFHSSSRTMMGRAGPGVSETYMTRTINGVTETIHKRREADGTEHVTLTYPDGRTKHTINGIEQPSSGGGALPPPARPPPPPAIAAPSAPGYGAEGGYSGDYRSSRNYHAPTQPYVLPAQPYTPMYSHGDEPRRSYGYGTDCAPPHSDVQRHPELRPPVQTTANAHIAGMSTTANNMADTSMTAGDEGAVAGNAKRHSKRLSLGGLLKPLVKLVKPHAHSHSDTKLTTH